LAKNEEEQLVDPMLMATSEDELREFSGQSPDVSANERPFNMGKPVPGHQSPGKGASESSGMLDGKLGVTNHSEPASQKSTKKSKSQKSELSSLAGDPENENKPNFAHGMTKP